ncbi:hypothetical protein HN011_001500 [Eciton burchellii]|nr:hypothetical protein HN011_001500 [Eciton burchellii]
MISIRKRYFNLNRLILLPIGLWPDKQTKFTRFRAGVMFSILSSSIVFQFSRLFIKECSFDLVVRILSSATFYLLLANKFILFWINMEVIKYVLDQLQHIYNELKDKNEIAIYEKYGYFAKRFTINMIIIISCSIPSSSLIPYGPYILDVIIPKNESYAIRTIELIATYFAISEKYAFLIIVHMNAACSIGLIVLIATGTIMVSSVNYICAAFEIAGYRIEQAMAINLSSSFDMKNDIVIQRKMIRAIRIHCKAIELCEYLATNFEIPFLFMIIITVLCTSFSLFRIFQIKPSEAMEEILLHLAAVVVILMYMFAPNYYGQEVTDHSNDIYVAAYNVSWYLSSLYIQKLVLFPLQRSNKIYTINVGKLFTGSLKNFATLTSASISYFTFLYSI